MLYGQLHVDSRHPLIGVGHLVVRIGNRRTCSERRQQFELAVERLEESRRERRRPWRARLDVVRRLRNERRRALEVGGVDADLTAAREPEVGAAVVGTRAQPVGDALRNADTRLDVVPVVLVRRLRSAAVRKQQPAFERERLSRGRIDRVGALRQLRLQRVHHVEVEPGHREVVLHGHRRLVVPAQAEVDGRTCGELPVVLQIHRVVAVLLGPRRPQRDVAARRQPEQEGREAVTRGRAGRAEGIAPREVVFEAERAVRVHLVLAVELVGAEFSAHLGEMTAHRLRDVAIHGVRVVFRLAERPREHAFVSADVDLRKRRSGDLIRALERQFGVDVAEDLVVRFVEAIPGHARVPQRARVDRVVVVAGDEVMVAVRRVVVAANRRLRQRVLVTVFDAPVGRYWSAKGDACR